MNRKKTESNDFLEVDDLSKTAGISKKIIAACVLAVIALVVIIVGIGLFHSDSHHYLTRNDLINYMDKKYDNKFKFVRDIEFSEYRYKATVENINYDVGFITVEGVVSDETDEITFHDNYILVKTVHEAYKKFDKLVSEMFVGCRVSDDYSGQSGPFQPDEFDCSTTFEECVTKCNLHFYYDVVLPADSLKPTNEQLEHFRQQCIDDLLSCTCCVYFDNDIYNKMGNGLVCVSGGTPYYSFSETINE